GPARRPWVSQPARRAWPECRAGLVGGLDRPACVPGPAACPRALSALWRGLSGSIGPPARGPGPSGPCRRGPPLPRSAIPSQGDRVPRGRRPGQPDRPEEREALQSVVGPSTRSEGASTEAAWTDDLVAVVRPGAATHREPAKPHPVTKPRAGGATPASSRRATVRPVYGCGRRSRRPAPAPSPPPLANRPRPPSRATRRGYSGAG